MRVLPLLDERMRDGSRHFALLPQSRSPLRALLHVFALSGAFPTAYLPSPIEGSWIDFRYKGHRFSFNDQYGDFWFFVKDPSCPAPTLQRVAQHFSKLLGLPPNTSLERTREG
jgi:hypothetical protein